MGNDVENAVNVGRPFAVKVLSTGEVFEVMPGQTIVEVLEEHGYEIPVSCGVGMCGTCLTGVVEGVPDHRDYYLDREEREINRWILPCCSRAKSDLLILKI